MVDILRDLNKLFNIRKYVMLFPVTMGNYAAGTFGGIFKDIELDLDAQAEDCYIAMEALCEVLHSVQPLIVYFPNFSLWLSRAVSKSNSEEFVRKVEEMFDQLPGPVLLICGQNKVETGSKEKEKLTMIIPNLGRLAKLVIFATFQLIMS
ncbi:unnamed protein product [Ilex paraguariensis]|uniref:Uncharacterized protein n=1 Tax=Ilex paraguariensis TaxID=185542 RepID=A0ABC8T1V7_9AQUA